MKKRLFFLIFLFFIFAANPILTMAATNKTRGLYTNLEFTSEFFPDYELMIVTISIQRTITLNLNSTYDLFMTGYRLVINTTLLAYIDHKNITENYIPEREKITLEFDKDELEVNATDYNCYHKLIVQISAVAIDPAGDFHKIADDYLAEEVFFAREATRSEVLQAVIIAFSPLIVLFAFFIFRRKVDKNTFENVSYLSMFKHSVRKFFTRNYDHHEEASIDEKDPIIKKEYLRYISHAIILAISVITAYLGSRFINIEFAKSIALYVSSFCFLLTGVFSTIKLFRKSESTEAPLETNTIQETTPEKNKPINDSEALSSKSKDPFWHRLLRFN
ncbi:MAG: hypothetical protein E3J70_03505 [Candidatus Heimdallarchaeota archaeon]|nr:MAG: hypothetical protein E3J70_03505 [Candidatus Heimdallarchaeota archaeon]